MIGVEDAPHTIEYEDYYKILPSIYDWAKDLERIGSGKKVAPNFSYSSDNNSEWMSIQELQSWLENE